MHRFAGRLGHARLHMTCVSGPLLSAPAPELGSHPSDTVWDSAFGFLSSFATRPFPSLMKPTKPTKPRQITLVEDGSGIRGALSNMNKESRHSDWPVVHGSLFVLLMAGTLAVPALRRWPWVWAIPLVAYVMLVALVPRLRNSLAWFRVGRISGLTLAATLGVIAATSLVLVGFHAIAQPDVHYLATAIPFQALGGVVMAGVVFTVINATLEELVFRGILYDAIQSQWGVRVTVVATAVLFGLGHLHGYPPGAVGAGLATAFGLVTGVLRAWTGGLALPILAHMGADATIYCILVHAGVV